MKKTIFFLVLISILIFPILLIAFGFINFNFSPSKISTTNDVMYSDDNYQYNLTENVGQNLDQPLELEKYDGYSLEELTKELGAPTYLIKYQPISNNIDSKILDLAIYKYNLKDPTATYFYFIDGEFYKSKNDEFNGIDTKNIDSYFNYQLENFK
jgi:hypothetical protein